MQEAEKRFKHWMRVLISIFILVAGYLIIADRYVPLTTQSHVQGFVVQISPEVSGYIDSVNSSNNQQVKSGDLLFSIDDEKYQFAVGHSEAQLEQAIKQEESLYAQVESAKATVTASQATLTNAIHEYNRIYRLSKTGAVSISTLDDRRAKRDQSAANLLSVKQNLHALESQLGKEKGQSPIVIAAENALKLAKLNLSHTKVIAQSDGVITNLQIHKGGFANANQPILTFIPTDSLWVAAELREKAAAKIKNGVTAEVAFDALPGEIFPFTVTSRDFGVASAQQTANGHLSSVEVSNRWVRDAQRVKINLHSEKPLPRSLFVGSKASVVMYPTDNWLMNPLGKILIRLVSYLHYIY
ncbi:MAG TPA: HlyD family secretion protein [Psychromonas hadalis]|nr:HlyD family secretion protein [Psychromonas hadalis]